MTVFSINPITRKRLRRFRQLKRGWWSFLLFSTLYLLTLAAELLCNSSPLLLRHNGEWYFPAFRFYPEKAFRPDGGANRPDYPSLERQGVFHGDFVLWAPVRNDPYRIIAQEELQEHLRDIVRVTPEPRVAGLTLRPDLAIAKSTGLENFLSGTDALPENTGHSLEEFWALPPGFRESLAPRWEGQPADSLDVELHPQPDSPFPPVMMALAASKTPRPGGRATIRVRLLELPTESDGTAGGTWEIPWDDDSPVTRRTAYRALPEGVLSLIAEGRGILRDDPARSSWESQREDDRRIIRVAVEREAARFPFRPIPGHWMGIDNAGRDVFARIFYALRIALNFGMLLVFFSLTGGAFAGILQGYRAGLTDLLCQRFIEIWSALPFLYIMILMGSLYGAGFLLLLVCYALFNWIGISYYMRAETLRLRKMPFVEAAKCIGLSGWAIAFRHILPNALVPLLTLFPFSLVGAIGSLAALDYLGFGLPAPTPSLGELLSQAQAERGAWWLTLFPALALFLVMLLGVFIGEGIRNAFDPRRQQRIQ